MTKNEPKVMECCSKTDFGMIFGRGQHAKSDGVLLQTEPPGNSQHGQHGQDDPPDRPEMRLLGRDRTPLPRAGGQDYVSSQANSLKLSATASAGMCWRVAFKRPILLLHASLPVRIIPLDLLPRLGTPLAPTRHQRYSDGGTSKSERSPKVNYVSLALKHNRLQMSTLTPHHSPVIL